MRPRLETLEERSLLSYTITDLGTLGGSVSEALGLNNSGQVVGESQTGAVDQYGFPIVHAFLWDATHGMRDLGTLSGDARSVAVGINDAGAVAGTSTTPLVQKKEKNHGFGTYIYYVSTDHAVTWNSTLKVQKLGDGIAYDINGSNEVVGTSNQQAILWSSGVATDLGTLGGSETTSQGVASAINDAGQVVGSAPVNDVDQTPRPFLWTPKSPDGSKGTMTNLGALDPSVGSHSGAEDINALGEVVGASDDLGLPHAFLDEGGTMYDLGTLSATYSSTIASSINASGVVVGNAFVMSASYANDHAWIWVPTAPNGTTGQMTDLNSLIPAGSGWVLNHASAVNDAGQIAGFGTINGVEHAFLLTPRRPSPWRRRRSAPNERNHRRPGRSVSRRHRLVAQPGGPDR